jgi:hypothetical protein
MGDTSEASSSGQEGHPAAPSHCAVLEGAGLTPDATASAITAPSTTAISLTVNGVSHRVEVEDPGGIAPGPSGSHRYQNRL